MVVSFRFGGKWQSEEYFSPLRSRSLSRSKRRFTCAGLNNSAIEYPASHAGCLFVISLIDIFVFFSVPLETTIKSTDRQERQRHEKLRRNQKGRAKDTKGNRCERAWQQKEIVTPCKSQNAERTTKQCHFF